MVLPSNHSYSFAIVSMYYTPKIAYEIINRTPKAGSIATLFLIFRRAQIATYSIQGRCFDEEVDGS